MSPRFSVIMPVHNAGPFIAEALASIAAQTVAPAEVIIIDDASSDDSMRKVAASTLDVQVHRIDARNAAAARNVGIAHATGEWLAFLDADDAWHPAHLARAAALLQGSDAVGLLAHHQWWRNGAPQNLPDSLRCKLEHASASLHAHQFASVLQNGFHFCHSTEIVRRSRVQAVGGFDEAQVRRHDIDLWLRVIAGHEWAWDTAIHAAYRIDNPNSLSKAEIDCELAYLAVLLRHEPAYAGEAMRDLIAVSARRAMGLTFVDGTAEQYATARRLGWSRLSAAFRNGYRLFSLAPPLARFLLRQKRAWLNSGS